MPFYPQYNYIGPIFSYSIFKKVGLNSSHRVFKNTMFIMIGTYTFSHFYVLFVKEIEEMDYFKRRVNIHIYTVERKNTNRQRGIRNASVEIRLKS